MYKQVQVCTGVAQHWPCFSDTFDLDIIEIKGDKTLILFEAVNFGLIKFALV